ncbi:uncharacterized protein OCT59_012459 [Rhizophagus irregularis]|uniref:DUF8211 domain-containing protein n=2 Tax=Rhizophagus irregularis TaxID=588596 RepID=U9URC3_RHIID|nr:hypothetical protein GLOIN_2v1484337 [Rhizophagus irregularis DAOM 181602=DAOM 197198]EXX50818.1 hypothetical protein RirG_267280 [Rhizophagus irregularis DAOM 197198w]POG63859.1 hypothetical protein GLOIN_2v1484337 [Rhizophagus irregularis DAOM 181602=DAOM 197198]UZO01358.1 hypothetical protein OCT59_012459 [Rhizophagus irregularis]CAG8642101.1 1289_t:CDS:1 [Rhizophagus irregularis]|eukprot:XP_025170725.1 hypothetical protein GLOIN_2v1484337 [Rhizophagus irregularis DAOM 181602=DAOM 197198]
MVQKAQNYMYRKYYSEFKYRYSSSKKRQEKRFERNRRRVFKKAGIDSISSTKEEKLLASRRSTFLLTESQYIVKPIMHLKYKKKFTYPLQGFYNFPIPHLKETSPAVPEVDMTSFFEANRNYIPPTPVLTHPIDVSKVPPDLIPYIPDYPVYYGDIHNHLSNKQKAQRKPLQVGSKKWKDHIRQIKFFKENQLAREQERLDRLDNAKLWNTSPHKVDQRLSHERLLNKLQDRYDDYRKIKSQVSTIDNLNNECKKLSSLIEDAHLDLALTQRLSGDTSDDTKAFEQRPCKRVANVNHNLDLLQSSHTKKRIRALNTSDDGIVLTPVITE